MATTALDVLKVSVDVLNDANSVRWTVPMLVRFLNAGQREIQTRRPDSTIFTASIPLVAGARQTLPDTSAKLLKVIRNTSGDMSAVNLIKQEVLDSFNPSWYSMTKSTVITDYMYDPREPSVFYVYPPAAATASVELSYSKKVTDVTVPPDGSALTAVTGNISLNDSFSNALSDYILFRAFALDAEVGSQAKSVSFWQLFVGSVGGEAVATIATSPDGVGQYAAKK